MHESFELENAGTDLRLKLDELVTMLSSSETEGLPQLGDMLVRRSEDDTTLDQRINLLTDVLEHLERDRGGSNAVDLCFWAAAEVLEIRAVAMARLECVGLSSTSSLSCILSKFSSLQGPSLTSSGRRLQSDLSSNKQAIAAWRVEKQQQALRREEQIRLAHAAEELKRRRADFQRKEKRFVVQEYRQARELAQRERAVEEHTMEAEARMARQREFRQRQKQREEEKRPTSSDPPGNPPASLRESLSSIRESTAAVLRRFKAAAEYNTLLNGH